MTDNSDNGRDTRTLYREALVPLLAFGGTLLGIVLWNAGILTEIQYAGAGGFLASCLLAYLAWIRPRKDIVSLTTPIYGFIFLVTPIDYTGGITLQLLYACGLTLLAVRLHRRFGTANPGGFSGRGLSAGPLKTYVESTREAFFRSDAAAGHSAAEVFISFSEGEYRKSAEVSHAACCRDGTPEPLVRAFSILYEHAGLLDKNEPRPLTYLTFPAGDAALMAKPLPGPGNSDREFETMMDNALLLLFSAGWHGSEADRPALLLSEQFAQKLLES
ncbi:MAG: hypothetical protein EHM53_11535 [Methanoregulaceae archaeon]|nr:MAG: hypothetical protein EHM53_11535 [Methanoregulaceae archaeon]